MNTCTCDPVALSLARRVKAPQIHASNCPSPAAEAPDEYTEPVTPAGSSIALNDDAALSRIALGI